MRRFNKIEITDQMLFNVLVDHKNRSFKQISEVLEELEFRKLSVDESLREEISKNIKNCTSCLKEMKSLDYVEIDLSNVFEYGQAYVAMSRVRNLEGLKIISIDYSKIRAHPKALEFYTKLN